VTAPAPATPPFVAFAKVVLAGMLAVRVTFEAMRVPTLPYDSV